MKGVMIGIICAMISISGYAMERHNQGEHMAQEAGSAGHQEHMAQEADSAGHHEDMAEEAGSVGKNLGICPVMGGESVEKYSYIHEGKTYYFCCQSCIEEFKKDPQKYISKTKEFKIEAYQFGYEPETITVKKGDIVKLLATSRDVTHGIYIKEYNINVSMKKGETKKIEFIADKAGEFEILCSVYCGRGHHSMKAALVVKQ